VVIPDRTLLSSLQSQIFLCIICFSALLAFHVIASKSYMLEIWDILTTHFSDVIFGY
jgi:hypothetical protein